MPDRKIIHFEDRFRIDLSKLKKDMNFVEAGLQNRFPLATLKRLFPDRFERLVSSY